MLVNKSYQFCDIVLLGCILSCVECTKNDILFLTPYIENEEVGQGRRLSEVNSSLMLGVKSYAGFITVDKKFDSNLWFWYFPVKGGDVENAPLMIWLQGGPGVSSLVGLFAGVGPFYYANKKIKENPYSWHQNHSMLFIDNPIGTGFSFSNSIEGYSTNLTQISIHLYEFLMQFMLLFPELQPVPFYLSGRSFAGKYIPSLARYIHNQNPTAKTFINLKGMTIGNGWIDPTHLFSYGDFIYQLGLGDFNFKLKLEDMERRLDESLQQGNMSDVNMITMSIFNDIVEMTGVSLYNYQHVNDDSCLSIGFKKFIEKRKIRKALHVGGSKYIWHNYLCRIQLFGDEMSSIVPELEEMLEHYRILVYNGQLDMMSSYPMLEKIYRNMKWSGAEKYRNAVRKTVFHEGKLYGYKKEADTFEELMIRNVGHCVASETPKLLQRIIIEFTCGSQCNNVTDWSDATTPSPINN